MYEFEYFKCKFVRIKSKISGLAEVESAGFFLSLLIANLLISHTESVRTVTDSKLGRSLNDDCVLPGWARDL
jgi:hypothetical protein